MMMPPISRYMSRQTWTIKRDATMAEAHALMRSHRIRHLPVLDAQALVGVVTERDLHLIETLPDSDPTEITVGDAMTEDVYAVHLEDAVAPVVETMAAHKYGSAIVVDRHGVVEGIFTTIDALQVLAEVLRHSTE